MVQERPALNYLPLDRLAPDSGLVLLRSTGMIRRVGVIGDMERTLLPSCKVESRSTVQPI